MWGLSFNFVQKLTHFDKSQYEMFLPSCWTTSVNTETMLYIRKDIDIMYVSAQQQDSGLLLWLHTYSQLIKNSFREISKSQNVASTKGVAVLPK